MYFRFRMVVKKSVNIKIVRIGKICTECGFFVIEGWVGYIHKKPRKHGH